tara:strand:- start:39 stop:263 length:225 start_codon:yes stop_codon:yes gene_type:complete
MDRVKQSELVGAITGVTASLMIALNVDLEVFAFGLYIISDIAWIYVGAKKRMTELLWMSIIFAIIGIVGVVNWM